MAEIPEILGTLERIHAARAKAIAELPCGTCLLDSEQARACRYYDQTGCKHTVQLGIRRAAEERIQGRIANLSRAGLDAQILADNDEQGDAKLQMVLRDELEPWTAVHAVRRALDSKTLRFLVLGGPHRTGKTLAMIYACALRQEAVYIAAQKLGRINQDSSRWVEAKLLCINELGREHLGNGYTASNLEELMAEREYGRKLTIFATNLPLKRTNADDTQVSLADRYGDLFMSRLEMPVGAYVVCAAGAQVAAPIPTRNPRAFNEAAERE